MSFNKRILVITNCTVKKLNYPAPAKELYQGPLFKKILKLVEKNNFELKILSAKYGLIDQNKTISPYNKTITNMKEIIKLRKKVIPQLKKIEDNYELIIIIMGRKYRKVLKPLFNNDSKYKMLHDIRGIGGLTSKINYYLKSPLKKMILDLKSCKV